MFTDKNGESDNTGVLAHFPDCVICELFMKYLLTCLCTGNHEELFGNLGIVKEHLDN